ncbi:MAG TPA: 5-formyltetrahydrofolate cyclo-ligase [Nitrososphaerales archaeon]|nr:5-formyltetrahydrofolate cyclo-ligase [Nitrososphaerales archaeon]
MLRGKHRGGGAVARAKKQEMRVVALRKRMSLDPEALAAQSSLVAANVLSLREYAGARLIASYCAKDDEVQTKAIIERALKDGKRVAVIVTDVPSKTLAFSEIESFEDDLAPGTFGILEPKGDRARPVPLTEADVVLVPLLAWDEKGQRLGYGAGYFDRALAGAPRITKVGLGLESQRFPDIPTSRHDVPLDIVVTEKRVVRPARRPGWRVEKAFKNRGRRSR